MDVALSVRRNPENRAVSQCGHSEWLKEERLQKNVFLSSQEKEVMGRRGRPTCKGGKYIKSTKDYSENEKG
jgi:hypothetical protein